MAYTGRPPAAAPLTSGDIPDGSITTADLIDDAVTPAKLSTGAPEWTSGYDFSLYEDTGTTAKFFWDASAESLGIGTSSPSAALDVNGHLSNIGAIFSKGAANQYGINYKNSSQTYTQYVDINNNGTDWWSLYDTTNSSLVDVYAPAGSGYRAFYTAGSERMRIDSSGRVTMPYQPSFGAYRSSGHINSLTDVVYNGTFHNVGNHYSTSTGRFTAPVTGLYHFYAYYLNTGGALSVCEIKLRINGSDRLDNRIFTASGGGSNQLSKTMSTTATLTAGDYVNVRVSYLGGTGAGMYGTGSIYCQFGGYLIG
jgi:hypothetical protein